MKRMILIYADSKVEHVASTNTFEPDLIALRRNGVIHITFKLEYTTTGHNSVEVATIDLSEMPF